MIVKHFVGEGSDWLGHSSGAVISASVGGGAFFSRGSEDSACLPPPNYVWTDSQSRFEAQLGIDMSMDVFAFIPTIQ